MEKIDLSELKRKMAVRFVLAPIVVALFFFLPAGTIDYWQGWFYMAVLFIPMIFVLRYFIKNDPELLIKRMQMKEKVGEQKSIVKFSYIFFLVGFVLPGLDFRYKWSQVPMEISIISAALVFLSYYMIFLVMRENSYLSRIVEVQKGQKVISTGPYEVVRHPMYTGVILLYIATPLTLGSYLAVLPFVPLIFLLVFRLQNEEAVLKKGLKGYTEYCRKVRWRLLPGIW